MYIKNEGDSTFSEAIQYLREKDISLAGAVHDFICPETNQSYIFIPIGK
jgi:hypothetical protein